MATNRNGHVFLLAIAVPMCLNAVRSEGQLQVGFYCSSCPQAELIVREEVAEGVADNVGNAAGLLRLHFHDCFVRGCDGSVLIDSTSGNVAEKDALPNLSLRGFEVVDYAKWRLEEACPGTVSCADILAFAARDAVLLSGGLPYEVPAGRRDGRISRIEDTKDLPPSFLNQSRLASLFASKELDQDDLVTLSGAHTIGRSHCGAFSGRLYGSGLNGSADPTLDAAYAAQLRQRCPTPGSDAAVALDPGSSTMFDNSYYKNILVRRGLLTSDQTLLSDGGAASILVKRYASDGFFFQKKFAAAMAKMGRIEVLTGSRGEIRANCRVIN